jgi:putative transposase
MPRKLRASAVGVAEHIIQRGNNRQICFANEGGRVHDSSIAQ